MRSTLRLLRLSLLLGPLIASAASVIDLRTEPVVLKSDQDAADSKEVTRQSFRFPWPIKETADNGMLKVEVDHKDYWVKPWNVVVDGSTPAPTVVCSRTKKVAGSFGAGDNGCGPAK